MQQNLQHVAETIYLMRIVEQLTPFTCGLACLESITTDAGCPVSQSAQLIKYKKLLYDDAADKGDFGAASPGALKEIWSDLGFKGHWNQILDQTRVRDEIFKKMLPNEYVLIVANLRMAAWHSFRLQRVIDDESISVMITYFPGETKSESLSFKDLISWDFRFAVLTL